MNGELQGGRDSAALEPVSAASRPDAEFLRTYGPEPVYGECCFCAEGLIFRAAGGWVHRLGGHLVRHCLTCDVLSSSWRPAGICPLCGGEDVVDDHIAVVKRA